MDSQSQSSFDSKLEDNAQFDENKVQKSQLVMLINYLVTLATFGI